MLNVEKVREPQCYEAFHCIGPECEDTCCDGWGILVDEATYGRYHDPATPQVAGKTLASLVEINPASASKVDFGRIKLEGSRCPVLTDGLCAIHRDLGEPYLADLCSMYPRVVSITSGVLERSLHLSCPEAARKVLLDPHAMAIVERAGDGQPFRENSVSLLVNDTPGDGVRRVRELAIEVIRQRSYPLWKRILSLGLAVERLADVDPANAVAGMENHVELFRTGVLDQFLNVYRGNTELQLETALELIVARIGSDYTSPRFLDCYREFMLGLEWNANSSMPELAARYENASQTWLAPFLAQHPYLLENYLINYIFRTLFPYRKKRADQKMAVDWSGDSMRSAFLLLGVHYALIHALMVGAAAFYKENLNTAHVLKAVQTYSKAFLHSGTFEGQASEFLGKSNEGKNNEELTRKIAVLIMD